MLPKRGVDYLAGGLLLALALTVIVFIATNPISADTFRDDPAGVLQMRYQQNIYFIEGQKTMAYEIGEELDSLPDHIISTHREQVDPSWSLERLQRNGSRR